VSHEGAFSSFKPILAGVPQGSVLGPMLYLLYTSDIQISTNTMLGTFANDTVIMATDATQPKAIEKLQISVNKIHKWTINWKIHLKRIKSVHVNFALRQKKAI